MRLNRAVYGKAEVIAMVVALRDEATAGRESARERWRQGNRVGRPDSFDVNAARVIALDEVLDLLSRLAISQEGRCVGVQLTERTRR